MDYLFHLFNSHKVCAGINVRALCRTFKLVNFYINYVDKSIGPHRFTCEFKCLQSHYYKYIQYNIYKYKTKHQAMQTVAVVFVLFSLSPVFTSYHTLVTDRKTLFQSI